MKTTYLLTALALAALPAAAQNAAPPLPEAPAQLSPSPAVERPAIIPPQRGRVTTKTSVGQEPKPAEKGTIMMNFQGAALGEVLNYLSDAAGFVIIQEAPITGTVNVVSRQPLNPDEAVDLINSVLIEKGFVALRSGRILKIVNRKDVQKRDLPVQSGSDPEKIPRKDEMVTQILPLKYGDAEKLIENLKPLLSESATISANESSNSILMTDTQTNIRRVALIIQALDTSVSSISTIRIFPLTFADAKELSTLLTQIFGTQSSGSDSRRSSFSGFPGFPGFSGGPPSSGGDDRSSRSSRGSSSSSSQSEARQAARVVCVADEQSNSVIVSAPEEVMPTIKEVITQIDTSITDQTEHHIFRLDAVELAEILTNIYADVETQSSQRKSGDSRSPYPFPSGSSSSSSSSSASGQRSERSLKQSKVVAVGDPRTNSLIVTAARDTMISIAETVARLDATDAKKQRVFVHSLEHADAESVAAVLRGMLGQDTGQSGSRQNGQSRLSERTSTGASMDSQEAFGSSGGGGSGGSTRR